MYKFLVQKFSVNKRQLVIYAKLTIAVILVNNISLVFASAPSLPQEAAVPGGIVKIAFNVGENCSSDELPKAYFNQKQVMVVPHEDSCKNKKLNKYYAIIGLPLDTKPGNYNLSYYDFNNQIKQKKFRVYNKAYKTSRITIKNNNMVEPDEKTQKKILEDQIKIGKASHTRTNNLPSNLIFQPPVSGFRTTSFGSRRIINNISKSPHSGMDIAAKINTDVLAVADGEVLLAENFYLPGNMVAINHGSGLITLYAHLNKITVKAGDAVKAGDLIGLVGSTGRVTGPHLHWAVKLNQASINPELFLKQDIYNG